MKWQKAKDLFEKEYKGKPTRGEIGEEMKECFPIIWENNTWHKTSPDAWEKIYEGASYGAVGVLDSTYGIMPIFV